MSLLLCLAAVSCWAAFQMQPGTFLPPVSWPVVSACIWLALLHLRPRLDGTDRRQAAAGFLSSAMLFIFLMQDGEFNGWGDVYFFCGSSNQYCTCSYRWNLAGWNKALVLWGYVLTTTLGLQRLMVQLVLQGLLPGEEVVMRESFISIGWRLIPYWLNNWEQQWGAECSSMMFELPQFAVELIIILPCVQILCSRMKVLAMPSVNAALPRGWDGASAEQIQEAFVPNVQRGCWERRPEQRHIRQRLRANRHVTAFAALLCLLAGFNSMFIPLHLEDAVLAHPRATAMQAVGRLPKRWSTAADLRQLSTQLQQGSFNLTHSIVTYKALKQVTHGRRAGMWRMRLQDVNLAEPVVTAPAVTMTGTLPAVGTAAAAVVTGRARGFAQWMEAVEQGPWQHNSTWASLALDELRAGLEAYQSEPNACPDVERFKAMALKHHQEIFRMQDPSHRQSVPLIEAALALMRLSTEKLFVLLSLYLAFLLFRMPPRYVAALISINARVSNTFARLVLYSFPLVCWLWEAGFVFSALVSVVFWGGPLWQVYHGLRTHACTVTVKGLRPATAAEIERMHYDCAICWCPMTVPGAASTAAAQEGGSTAGTAATASSSGGAAGAVLQRGAASSAAGGRTNQQLTAASAAAPAAAPAVPGGQQRAAAAAADSSEAIAQQGLQPSELVDNDDGSTLPCGHCYHQSCLTQWLQQCHGQGTTPTCPMCQARMQLTVKWHLWKALFAPSVWQLPTRRRGRLEEEEPLGAGAGAAVAAAGPEEAVAVEVVQNNYLLSHNPRLAELLADMPQFLAPENVQLLADVQELRWQRQQLANELHLRQQQLQRQHELEMRLELQRQQLLNELQLLAQQLQLQQAQQHGQPLQPDQQPRLVGDVMDRLQLYDHNEQQQPQQHQEQQHNMQQLQPQQMVPQHEVRQQQQVPAGPGEAPPAQADRRQQQQQRRKADKRPGHPDQAASSSQGAAPSCPAAGQAAAAAAAVDQAGSSSSSTDQAPTGRVVPPPPAAGGAPPQQQQQQRQPFLRWRWGRRA